MYRINLQKFSYWYYSLLQKSTYTLRICNIIKNAEVSLITLRFSFIDVLSQMILM